MLSLPVISLVMSCRDPGTSLDRTILSIAAQAGNFRIRFHVRDHGSSDGTLERLEWWKERFSKGDVPLQCDTIWFSFAGEPSAGRFEALCHGIDEAKSGDGFLGWLEPGDQLLPGALCFVADAGKRFAPEQVSWIAGATSASAPNTPSFWQDIPLPRAALRAGLCDGVHWERLQSAGVFFRPWLWNKADPEHTLRALDHTGDWALWRRFAEIATPVQTRFALATTPERREDDSLAEIDRLLPRSERERALTTLCDAPELTRRVFEHQGDGPGLSIVEEGCASHLASCHEQVFARVPTVIPEDRPAHVVHTATRPVHQVFPPLRSVVSFRNNIMAYDSDWQYPAVTEQYAFSRLRELGAVPDDVIYVAFPWATLIDKLQRKTPDSAHLLERFRAFCEELPANTLRITVCQHIKMKECLYLFREAGITEIFWSHATHEDVTHPGQDGIRLRPFPLFPVQVREQQVTGKDDDRPYLFSFIGARANQHYLTESRNWILDLLGGHPDGLIIGRDGWHYNKVVYDHQVLKTRAREADGHRLVDQSASDEFRVSLLNSLFSLCPSGSGPNSIRLWESLGAGAIPVILADTYAPPGNPKLWQAAAVFCNESAEEIRALPARLEEIARDPGSLAAMRHAGRQLWMLYGPGCFIYDIQTFLLEDPASNLVSFEGDGAGLIVQLSRSLSRKDDLTEADATLLLQSLSSDLLLHGQDARDRQEGIPGLFDLIRRARSFLTDHHASVRQFDQVLALLKPRVAGDPASAVSLNNRRMRICLYGKHSNRTPLSYAPFQRLAADRVMFVEDPLEADVLLTGFNADLRENAEALRTILQKQPDTRIVILSEEPLWDSIWSDGFTARERISETGLPYTFLNHTNTDIFDFERIPYFLLTHEDFQARYGLLISRHTNLSPRALLEHWENAPIPAAFFAEHRSNPAYDKSWPDSQVFGLSVYRTRVAEAMQAPGILRVGKGWNSDAPRQKLPDWHLDKLAALDMRARVMGTYENTHQHAYISEKIFDAFVVGAIPTYFADPDHRVFDLVPEAAMINTYGLEPSDAAERIGSFSPDTGFAEAWLETARSLQARFSDLDAITQERNRIVEAVLQELETCCARSAAA